MILFLWSAAGFLGGALSQASGPQQISPDWTVDLRTVGAIAGVILPATYWIARTITKIHDRLDQQDKNHVEFRKSIEDRIDNLPCGVKGCAAPPLPPKKNR